MILKFIYTVWNWIAVFLYIRKFSIWNQFIPVVLDGLMSIVDTVDTQGHLANENDQLVFLYQIVLYQDQSFHVTCLKTWVSKYTVVEQTIHGVSIYRTWRI